MSLLDLPECEPHPVITTFEAEGWEIHAATWKDDHGQALMSKGDLWAVGFWMPLRVESKESEREARNAYDRYLPPLGGPRVSNGN